MLRRGRLPFLQFGIEDEVLFSYDNSYYTHCYHQTVKEYKSNGSLIRSKTDYYQAIGG